jgi:hypothetical protein
MCACDRERVAVSSAGIAGCTTTSCGVAAQGTIQGWGRVFSRTGKAEDHHANRVWVGVGKGGISMLQVSLLVPMIRVPVSRPSLHSVQHLLGGYCMGPVATCVTLHCSPPMPAGAAGYA